METLFRKYFWVFHLVFLALVAWLIAGTANAIALHFLTGEQKAPVATSGGASARDQVRTRNFNIPNEANIFGALREDLTVPESQCEEDKDCPTGKCDEGQCVSNEAEPDGPIPELANAVQSQLRAKLVSTAVFQDASFSVASIVDLNDGRKATSRLYSINKCIEVKAVDIAQTPVEEDESEDDEEEGDSTPIARPLQPPCNDLMGVATIKVIEPNRVYFYNRDEKQWEFIVLGEEPEGGAKVSRRKPKKKKSKKDEDLGKGIKKTGDNSYEVEQSEVDKALGNLSSLATQARIVPAFEGGKPVGFKLFSIRPNSLYSKIGVQNGDVIKRINGYEINSPDKALEIYQKLKDSKNVTVDLKRRGKPMTLEYGIVP